MRIASRGPSSSSTTSTRGSGIRGSPSASLGRARQGQDEADLALLPTEDQAPPVPFDDLLAHAGSHVQQPVRGDGQRAEQTLSFQRREDGRAPDDREANGVGPI